MGSRFSLQAAFLGFACLSGSLWYAGRRAEQGVEIAQRAAEVLAPLAAAGDLEVALEAETPEGGTTDAARASLGKGAQALFDRLELGAGSDPRSSPSSAAEPPPRRSRSGPWPKWVDEAPEHTPRTVRVRLVDGGSALQSIGRVHVGQRSRGERRDARAYRLSEDDPTLWGIGSPGLLTGAPARSNKSQWVRSPRGGVVHPVCESGDAVREGDLLAVVCGLIGEDPEELLSPINGIIIGHATLPVVHQGDALFHIAAVAHPERVGERIESITEAIDASEPEGFAEALLDEDEVG